MHPPAQAAAFANKVLSHDGVPVLRVRLDQRRPKAALAQIPGFAASIGLSEVFAATRRSDVTERGEVNANVYTTSAASKFGDFASLPRSPPTAALSSSTPMRRRAVDPLRANIPEAW